MFARQKCSCFILRTDNNITQVLARSKTRSSGLMWPGTFLTSLCLLLESSSSYFLVYNMISISCDVFGTHPIDLDFIEIKVCKQRYFIILFSHIIKPPLLSALTEYDNLIHSFLK